jgi:hypothetical protein
MAQVWLLAMGAAVQSSVSLKSPVASIRLMMSGAAPVLVTVTVCGSLAVETACVPKVSAAGLREIAA